MKFLRLFLSVAIVLAVSSTSSWAAQVLSLDLTQLTSRSDVVVRGVVQAVHSEPVPGAEGRIHTRVTLSVQESFKAMATGDGRVGVLDFYTPGGVLGRYGQWVPGAARFVVGQEVLLFLAHHEATGRLSIVGLSQGRYLVDRSVTPAGLAVSERTGLHLLSQDPQGRWVPTPGQPAASRVGLPALRRQIRALLAP